MENLSKLDILRFVAVSSKLQNRLNGTEKLAADDNSEFNEKPPINEEEDVNGEKKSKDEAPVSPVEEVPAQPQAQAGNTPEEVGARAAQAFLGPETMMAAANGDPAATEIVSRTAGHVAGAVAEAALKMAPMSAEAPVPPVMSPAQGAPVEAAAVPAVQPTSPEEAVANSLVPQPVEPVAGPIDAGKAPNTAVVPPEQSAPVPAQGFPPKKDESGKPAPKPAPQNGQYDAETVGKLIELAKAGKI